jgi:hypothetical protein
MERPDMTYLVTKNATTNVVNVAHCTLEQFAKFEVDDNLDPAIMGWFIKSASDFADTSLSNKDLLGLYNVSRKPDSHLVKFPNKQAAFERTFNLLEYIIAHSPAVANVSKPKTTPKRERQAKTQKGGITQPVRATLAEDPVNGGPIDPCRADTKQAMLVDALARVNGASLTDLIALFPTWQVKSIRSGVYWDVAHVKGYGIRTTWDAEDPRFHLIYQRGMTVPVPHSQKKTADKTE